MAVTAQWIMDKMEAWAPKAWAVESDNVGLLIGDKDRAVGRVLTTLEVSEGVLKEAVQGRFDFIVAHHPLISRHVQPIQGITTDNALGKKIMTLIGNGIGLYCAHTNLDAAEGGVNDLLFDKLDLKNKEWLIPPVGDVPTMGRIGYFPYTIGLSEFARHVGECLELSHTRYVGSPYKMVMKVGLCAGNGTSLVKDALAKKCDVYITGDLHHHLALDTLEAGMAMVDGTHYATEVLAAEAIAARLRQEAEKEGQALIVESAQNDGTVFRVYSQ